MEKLNNAQKEIRSAYDVLAGIPVSGDFVELMAIAREHLRLAYRLTTTATKEGELDG